MTPDTTMRLQEIRQKAIAGTASLDDLREGVRLMREDRVGAAATSAKAKASSAPVDTAGLLSQLMGD